MYVTGIAIDMLKTLQKLPKDQTLVAHTGVQFVDYGFRFDETATFSRSFVESREQRPDGKTYHVLRPIKQTPPMGFVDAETEQPVNTGATYSVQLRKAIEAYDGIWLPAPFFKLKSKDEKGKATFEPGPSNWARLRVTQLESPDADGFTHRLVLAFDTNIEQNPRFLCPAVQDVQYNSPFEFAAHLRDNSWFLEEAWVAGWLTRAFDQAVQTHGAMKPRRQDGQATECAHWASYVVLLQGLDEWVDGKKSNAPMPTVRFINTLGTAPVAPTDVDLILDIGNSRTCGVLVETSGAGDLSIGHSTVLELRDLSRPHLVYSEPFRSHVEFVRPSLGDSYWSKESGLENAFYWASLVRAGPEALRLHEKSTGAEGDTGLSSPKRYLWDERENRQPWYFNVSETPGAPQAPVGGDILLLLTSSGELREWANDATAAFRASFSRSSLFMFLVMELLLQAVVQINSPSYRRRTTHPDVPRRLRRVVYTIPTATPLVERQLYQRRCTGAAVLLWKAMGWDAAPGGSAQPQTSIAYDEATCTQILYLYNETVRKFGKSATEFFKLIGRGSGQSLRVASIDVGGGTSDLMITTYAAGVTGAGLTPTQNFREGFRRAGDDILEAIIAKHVLEPLQTALEGAGMQEAHAFLSGLMSDADQDALQRHLRRLFVSRIMMPIALALLGQYETTGALESAPINLASVLGDSYASLHHVIEFFDENARAGGAKDFSLSQMAFDVDVKGLAATAEGVIGPILSVMGEVIERFDCDALLISGRPSRLPIIRDILLRLLPIMPHRLVFMHEYRVGNWYPFARRGGAVEDPKTTVVVGALLCALAGKASIADFSLDTRGFRFESTANYIGRIWPDGSIPADKGKLVFASNGGKFAVQSERIPMTEQMFLGFRQLPLERWPGTPLYFIDIAENFKDQFEASQPWRLTFVRPEPENDATASAAKEAISIELIEDSEGQPVPIESLNMRLQTLRDDYWLETGVVRF